MYYVLVFWIFLTGISMFNQVNWHRGVKIEEEQGKRYVVYGHQVREQIDVIDGEVYWVRDGKKRKMNPQNKYEATVIRKVK